ncbi:glycosyltransferase [Patescibacteria group bacterium]|nr:glycosyltransferase [Patescibacteria group bacterium]MBU2259295.1 glycosyltransferase [Patescibacteria group bacterium]
MKIVLVADWLPLYAGAEHVIAEFHTLWRDAPIYTTIANHGHLGPLNDVDIRTSSLQKWYKLCGKHHRVLLPLMPRALERIDLNGYDVILSSSHAIGKGIIPPPSARHICYCHTPMRYAWEMEDEYLTNSRIPKIFWKPIKKRLNKIRRWDMTTAKRVDQFIANSSAIADRIKKVYNRDAIVIHPPVSDRFFEIAQYRNQASGIRNQEPGKGFALIPDSGLRNGCFLAIGRMVPYKRFDLLIECANKHQIPLHIAGIGPERERLERLAGPSVTFLGFVPESDLPRVYSESKALLLPQEEDAGIVPLEAQACGTPVISFGRGGAMDTVKDGVTGVFFEEQTVESLKDAIDRFEKIEFNREAIRKHAEQFSAERFREKITQVISKSSY